MKIRQITLFRHWEVSSVVKYRLRRLYVINYNYTRIYLRFINSSDWRYTNSRD